MPDAQQLLDHAIERYEVLRDELDIVNEQLVEMTRLWAAEREARMALIAAVQTHRARDDAAPPVNTDPFAAERVCAVASYRKCQVNFDIVVHANGTPFRIKPTKKRVSLLT